MDDTSPGTTRVPTAHEPGEDAQTMDAVQDPLRDSSVSSTSDGLMDPAEVSAPELDGPQQRSSNDASPASEDSELMCLASPPHHMRDAFANNDEDTDDELRNDAAALRRENTANDERNVLPLFSPLEEPDGEYDEDPEVAGGDSAESLMLPAHILRQIELLNAEVEQDPKSIWMQGNRVFAPRSILDIDEALEAEAAASVPASTARTRHPSSAVTMHDLSPPADMDVMFGWPPELEEAVEDRRRLWANVLGEEEAEASPKTGSQRLRDELLHFGPPKSIRRVVWRSVASLEELSIETLFRQLKEDNSPFEKLISRDVPRTFPKLGMFREDAGPGQELLGNVLKAYSVYDGEVGYCQGMSFVVAGLLIVGLDEAEAFAMLVRLMEGFPPFFRDEGDGLPLPGSRSAHYAYPLRHLYTPGMPLLHALLHLLTYFMNQRMPELHRHLEEAGLEPATWASQWFLTLFTYSFPRFVWERGWDMCFAEIGEQIETGSDAAGGEESSQAMKSSPNTTGKPKKTYYLPRTLLILALSALEHAKPRLLETSDAEVLLQLLRGDRICNDFERCRQVVDLAADWCQDESVVEVTEVRKKMREFWKSIVDRVNSRSASPTGGRSSADAAPPPPDKRGKVGGGQSRIFGFLRGRDSQTGPDLQELKAALLMWQRRAEAAENEVEHLRAELFDAKMNTPRGGTPPHPRDDEEWRAEKEMWREEVLRLTRETDVRETELLRLNELLATLNARMEELESLNLELSEENARIKNLVRSSSGPSAPHPSRMPNNSIPHPKSKVLPPPPPRPGSPTSRQGDQSSWTSRILHSVKETVFGDDEDGSGNGFDGPPNLPDKRRRQRASPNGESESSDESDSPRSRTHRSRMIAPNPHSVAYSANGPSPALRKSSGPTSGRGSHSGSGLMVITAEMREAGGKVFRSPSGVAKKATDNHVEKGK